MRAHRRGVLRTPPTPSAPALPRGPWETLSHTRSHKNSSLVFNHGPLKQCPEKYRADEWFSELGAFRSGHSVRPEQLASSQEPSIVFIFLLMGILFARAAEGLQERPRPWTTVKPRDLPHLHARPADASSQTVNLFPKCSGDCGGELCVV